MRVSSAITGFIPGAFAAALAIATAWCLALRPPQHRTQSLPGTGPVAGESPTVSRRVRIMDFKALAGPTTVVFRYTPLVAGAAGQAEIEPVKSMWKIRAFFSSLPAATTLGAPYLTYTLWAVTPGGTTNLGEVERTGSDGRINTKFKSPQFGLMVTVEPYFGVSDPSSAVAFEADLAPGTAGNIPWTRVSCELLRNPIGSELAAGSAPDPRDPSEPLLFEEARRALATARAAGAAAYAPQTLDTAVQMLQIAGKLRAQRAKQQDIHDAALEAVLIAEDARVLAVNRQRRSHTGSATQDHAP
jgi:hypothetical protein